MMQGRKRGMCGTEGKQVAKNTWRSSCRHSRTCTMRHHLPLARNFHKFGSPVLYIDMSVKTEGGDDQVGWASGRKQKAGPEWVKWGKWSKMNYVFVVRSGSSGATSRRHACFSISFSISLPLFRSLPPSLVTSRSLLSPFSFPSLSLLFPFSFPSRSLLAASLLLSLCAYAAS